MIAFFVANYMMLLSIWAIGFVVFLIATIFLAGFNDRKFELTVFLLCLVWPVSVFYDLGGLFGLIVESRNAKNRMTETSKELDN